jgi:hypothetical protein
LPLAGLIIATEDGCAAALQPVAGQTLVEYQVRAARMAGAGHIVLLVDQIPGPLVAAFDRLRADNISIDVARDVRDAADRIHPDEALLVFAEGVVADLTVLKALASAGAPLLLTVPADNAGSDLERIDADAAWTGLALLNGKMLRDTVAMLGDWSLAPTLLRASLASGVGRMPLSETAILAKVRTAGDASVLTRRLASLPIANGQGLVTTHVFGRLAALISPALLTRNVPLDLMAVLPLVLLASALLLIVAGWPVSGLALSLIAGFLGVVADGMTRAGLREMKGLKLFDATLLPFTAITLLVLGWQQVTLGVGWGAGVLALWAATALVLVSIPRPKVGEAWLWLLVLMIAQAAGFALTGFALLIGLAIGNQILIRWRAR